MPTASVLVGESTFGGAAAGDCDNDGDIDLFITYGDGGPNRLYLNQLNQGNPLQFQDIAAEANVAFTNRTEVGRNDRHSGPTFADMDGDGDLDLFIGGLFGDYSKGLPAPNKLYRNRGECVFDDVTENSGIDNPFTSHTISAAFGDYDLDGYPDLFLTHWDSVDGFPGGGPSEHLFHNVSNDESIRFKNVSASSGVTALLVGNREFTQQPKTKDYTYTPAFARIDDDVWPDIALAADFSTSQLLLNNGAAGTFRDASNDAVHSTQYGMGSALGDYDFDGDLDWFISAVYGSGSNNAGLNGNRLLRNPGDDFSGGGFENVTDEANVAIGGWGWGSCFVDLDNDTDLDIYHTNGWEASFATDGFAMDRSRAFVSDAAVADGVVSFVDRADSLGLDDEENGRGVVCADFDNDGDIDILQLTNSDGNSAFLWANASAAAGNNFLRVKLIGLPPNTEAAGARIFATIGDRTQMREIMIGSNYTSQNPTVQIFGLGPDTQVDAFSVEWPALVPGEGRQPLQPASTEAVVVDGSLQVVNTRVGVPGATLVVCHPGLQMPEGCDL